MFGDCCRGQLVDSVAQMLNCELFVSLELDVDAGDGELELNELKQVGAT